jgi:hypothetical protein
MTPAFRRSAHPVRDRDAAENRLHRTASNRIERDFARTANVIAKSHRALGALLQKA